MSNTEFAIMFIGATRFEEKSYRIARRMGLAVIMTDRDPKCLSFQFADEYWVISADDVAAVLDCYRNSKFREKLIFAYSGNDFGTHSAIAVNSEILRLSTVTKNPSLGNNKIWMKRCFQEFGINVPDGLEFHRSAAPENVLSTVASTFTYPFVCKPADSSGARGVSIVHSENEFFKAWEAATCSCQEGQVLIEEHISGQHLDMNAFVVNGEFFRSGSSDRFFLPEPSRVSIKNYAPSTLNQTLLEKAWQQLEYATRALGLVYGPIKADFIVSDAGEPYLLETAFRFHGGLTSCGSMAVSGTSFSLFQMIGVMYPQLKEIFQSCWIPIGTVGIVHILVDLVNSSTRDYKIPQNLPNIDNIFIRMKPNEKLYSEMRDNRDILGYIIAGGKTREECDLMVSNALFQIR